MHEHWQQHNRLWQMLGQGPRLQQIHCQQQLPSRRVQELARLTVEAQEAEATMTAAEVSVAATHCLWQMLRQVQRQPQMFCFAAVQKASDGKIVAAQQTLADQRHQVAQMHWQQYSKLRRMLSTGLQQLWQIGNWHSW